MNYEMSRLKWNGTPSDRSLKSRLRMVEIAIKRAGKPLGIAAIKAATNLYDEETRNAVRSGIEQKRLVRVARGVFRLAGEV